MTVQYNKISDDKISKPVNKTVWSLSYVRIPNPKELHSVQSKTYCI